MFSSLTNRIFIATAALAILCISTAIYVVNVRVTRSAEDEMRRELVQTGALVDQQRATMSDMYAVLARFVDQMSNLKAAVTTGDPPTVEPLALEYQRQVGADLLLVTDRSGHVLANLSEHGAADPAIAALPTVREALTGREAAVFWRRPNGVAQVVSVPIIVGPAPADILGSFSLGFLFDDSLAMTFKRLSGSEIAFAADGQIVASTLPVAARPALVPLIGKAGVSSVSVGSDQFLALERPLAASRTASLFGHAASGPPIANETTRTAARPVAIVLRSRTERLRFLRPIQTALIATGILAVLLAIVLSYAIARTIARPLAAITSTMRDMASTGDLTRKIAWRSSRWEDEDAALLARTFNTLTDSVTRFQREAAERERLSALGRLSTVVAHEVRNPLMIIKASLRPLLRPSVSPDIREAAEDIGEEVTRLNRLVNEVLDFARPLRFEFAPADVNRVCEESAAAASTDSDSSPVHLDLDPAIGLVMTDAERLRSALVNILVNARHAVSARRAGQVANGAARAAGGALQAPTIAAESAGVALTTSVVAGGRFAIIVQDDGVGIEPRDLSRVFEPYFTTKRAGTGLGLAIARNIVEGLGGTIAIDSAPGVGTEIRIDLPIGERS